jgi:hypothetical protein
VSCCLGTITPSLPSSICLLLLWATSRPFPHFSGQSQAQTLSCTDSHINTHIALQPQGIIHLDLYLSAWQVLQREAKSRFTVFWRFDQYSQHRHPRIPDSKYRRGFQFSAFSNLTSSLLNLAEPTSQPRAAPILHYDIHPLSFHAFLMLKLASGQRMFPKK